MSFSLTDEQSMLRDTLRGFLAKHRGDAELWRRIADELGLLGLTFPETDGGLGCGPVEAMLVMEEFGAALVAEPFLEVALMASTVLRSADVAVRQSVARSIVDGSSICVLAHAEPDSRGDLSQVRTAALSSADGGYRLTGHKAVVVGAPQAQTFIVSARTSGDVDDAAGISLFLVDANSAGLERKAYRTIDGRHAADIMLTDVPVQDRDMIGPKGEGLSLIQEAVDVGIAAICAEAAGVMRELLAQTLSYARERRQGGRTLAEYQVLQHRMVEMMVQTQQARAMARVAANKLRSPPDERAMAVSAAKAFVGKAARKVGQAAIQIHGAMGMTDEIPVGHLFRRTTAIESQFGSVDHHVARYAQHALAAAN